MAGAERHFSGARAEPADRTPAGEVSLSFGLLTPEEAAAKIQRSAPALVIFFTPGCPLSRRAFPQFTQLSSQVGGSVSTLAFANDSSSAEVDAFLRSNSAGFSADLLSEWQPGESSAALGAVGLHVGKQWVRPLIAVLDGDGRVVGEWQGIMSLAPVQQALRTIEP